LSQFCAPCTIVTTPLPLGLGENASETVAGPDGGISSPALSGTARLITRRFVSDPVSNRKLPVSVARRESELVHGAPSISVLNVLPPFGVAAGGGVVVKVTLKTPSVIDLEPVAPVPGTATSEKEKVPDALVEVSVVKVTVPLPLAPAACHPDAGLPTDNCAFVALIGPTV